MLELLRKQKRGVFGLLIVAFCAALMLPFGLDQLRNTDKIDYAVKVDDTKIDARQFYNRLQQVQEIYRTQLGKNYSALKKMLNLEQKTADDLVHGVLVNDFMTKLGLGVSVLQIEEKIASHPFFKDTGITKSSFETFLRAQGLNSAALEDMTKKQILMGQLEKLFEDFTKPSKKEEEIINKQNSRLVKLKYLEFKPEKFKPEIKIEDKQKLIEYFNKHSEEYLSKKAVEFSAVSFIPQEFTDKVEIDENEIKEIYENDQNTYFEPEQVKLKQYVVNKDRFTTSDDKNTSDDLTASTVKAKEYINKAAEKIKAGEDFDKVVGNDSDQPVNTDWINSNVLESEVHTAVNALDLGETSNVIETAKYFKIVKLVELKQKTKKSLEQVKPLIETKIKNDSAPEYARAAAENFMSKVADSSLSEQAEKIGKKAISTTKAISAGETLAGLTPNAIKQILELQEGSLETINDGDTTYVVQVSKVIAPEVPAFEKVEEQVKEAVINIEAAEMAKKVATQARDSILSGTSFEEVAKVNNTEIITSDFISKDKPAPAPFTIDADKTKALSTNPDHPTLKDIITENGSFYVVKFDQEKQDTEKKEDKKEAGANRLFDSLIKYLKSKADIKIDPSILEENS